MKRHVSHLLAISLATHRRCLRKRPLEPVPCGRRHHRRPLRCRRKLRRLPRPPVWSGPFPHCCDRDGEPTAAPHPAPAPSSAHVSTKFDATFYVSSSLIRSTIRPRALPTWPAALPSSAQVRTATATAGRLRGSQLASGLQTDGTGNRNLKTRASSRWISWQPAAKLACGCGTAERGGSTGSKPCRPVLPRFRRPHTSPAHVSHPSCGAEARHAHRRHSGRQYCRSSAGSRCFIPTPSKFRVFRAKSTHARRKSASPTSSTPARGGRGCGRRRPAGPARFQNSGRMGGLRFMLNDWKALHTEGLPARPWIHFPSESRESFAASEFRSSPTPPSAVSR